MKALKVFTAVVLGTCVIALGVSYQSAWASGVPPVPALVASINLTNAQVRPDNPALVQAFIPTGSKSVKCLLTMNETTFVHFGTQVFCGERDSPTYGSGVVITIDYFDQAVPPDYGTSLTLWQEGAKFYGQPILCTTAGLC